MLCPGLPASLVHTVYYFIYNEHPVVKTTRTLVGRQGAERFPLEYPALVQPFMLPSVVAEVCANPHAADHRLRPLAERALCPC